MPSKVVDNVENKKLDPWSEIVHFSRDHEARKKIDQNHKKLSGNFINYIHHVENQKQVLIESARKEMELLKSSS